MLAEQVAEFYPDLLDDRFESAFAIYHQRYSTNTFPQWWLAQPFRMLAHNGEINTLKGNVNWMKSHEIRMASGAFGEFGRRISSRSSRDGIERFRSARFGVFEVLVRAGRNAPMAKTMLVPESVVQDSAARTACRRGGTCTTILQCGDGALGWARGPRHDRWALGCRWAGPEWSCGRCAML